MNTVDYGEGGGLAVDYKINIFIHFYSLKFDNFLLNFTLIFGCWIGNGQISG